jgi:uncharacterized membrane protein
VSPKKSRFRHLAKTLTWRVIASATTFGLALFFFADDPRAMQKAGGIAVAETVIKMIMYYFHERAWFRYGRLGRGADDTSKMKKGNQQG